MIVISFHLNGFMISGLLKIAVAYNILNFAQFFVLSAQYLTDDVILFSLLSTALTPVTDRKFMKNTVR